MDTTARLEALAALPKTWRTRFTYESGDVRDVGFPSQAMAERHAERYQSRIGKPLIDRETGATVRYVRIVAEPNQ